LEALKFYFKVGVSSKNLENWRWVMKNLGRTYPIKGILKSTIPWDFLAIRRIGLFCQKGVPINSPIRKEGI